MQPAFFLLAFLSLFLGTAQKSSPLLPDLQWPPSHTFCCPLPWPPQVPVIAQNTPPSNLPTFLWLPPSPRGTSSTDSSVSTGRLFLPGLAPG